MTVQTNPLTYNAYVQQVCEMAVIDPPTLVSGVMTSNADFQVIVPSMLNFAELRIQRDLDLNALQTTGSYTLTSGVSLFSVPADDFVTVQTIVANGVPLLPVSKEFVQNCYPPGSTLGAPAVFAVYGGDATTFGITLNNFLIGPPPAGAYAVTVAGTVRAPSLYKYATTADAGSKTTFISEYLPDLLIQASMIYISEFQRNFLPTSSDPQMLGAYEGQYQNLLKGAIVEEARKKFQASGWSSMAPPVVASATR